MDLSLDELSVALGYAVLFNGSAAPAPAAAAAKKAAPAPKKAAPADDDMDLFGDEEEVDENGETAAEKAANAARAERMAQALRLKEEKDAREGKVKKEKAKAVEKSLVVLEVKPWEADTDLVALWHEIVKYQQDGLTWGESYKLEPVAFGIKKLVLTCTIIDAQVLMEDITDAIEKLEDYVQSVNVASMNKIS
jgi:translation elongation factor EF-1beta